jgi:NAD(P)-dependent dehydrogenase (short-subunit alcohol dehydrogenase family)
MGASRLARMVHAQLPEDGEVTGLAGREESSEAAQVRSARRSQPGGGFAGQVAIVTGGGSGIGAALVRALTARGATVVIADIDEVGAKSVTDSVRAAGGAVSTAVLDVRDSAAVADLVNQTAAEHGSLDLMFNNAGIAVGGLVEELTLDHWDQVLDVNVRGVVHGVHAAYPLMLRQGHGHIVNNGLAGWLVPGPSLAPYAAAKHAVGLSLSLRAEGASRGVRVSAVCPGFVDTPLLGRVNPGLPQTETAPTRPRSPGCSAGFIRPIRWRRTCSRASSGTGH